MAGFAERAREVDEHLNVRDSELGRGEKTFDNVGL
jgi:hypothetical protein